ncbi:hypothetical protein GOV05_04515 [Candidatus Woesearchaeota archaeon]|nr:hypothetical protein [Candidatus Woesearchaeota archaeon]
MEADDYIGNICKTLSLPIEAKIWSKKLHDKAIKAAINAENPKAAVALACIYAWCQKNSSPVVLYEMESASFIESELITKAFGDIQNEIGVQ